MCKVEVAGLHWTEYEEAAEIIDDIFAIVAGSKEVSKAAPNILTDKGFDKWIERYARRVFKKARVADKAAIRRMLKVWRGANWKKLTPDQQAALIDRGVKKLALTAAQRVDVSATVALSMKEAIKQTMNNANSLYGIQAVYDAVDERVVRQVRKSQSHYIRDAYGRRQAGMSREARRIVSRGVRAGLDPTDIGAMLNTEMTAAGLLRAESYWSTVSSIYAARARQYGLFRSYDEATIEQVKFEAILDERTTEQCYFMDGKIISVKQSIQRFQDIAADPDPEAVVDRSPFLQLGKTKQGKEVLYYKKDGKRVVVADVRNSARGTKDGSGSYRQRMSDQKLADAGIGPPPLHGRCRSTTVPV